ncbi:MAG: hypothetical protein AAGI45_19495 [Cyanobacteria bacterium P01_H01_bin.26]
MLNYIAEQINQKYLEVIGVAQAAAEQQTDDFVGDCFFIEVRGQLYRLDTAELLTPEKQNEISEFAQSLGLPPDWPGFSDAIPIDVLAAIAETTLSSMIVSRLTRLADSAVTWGGPEDPLITLWNQVPPELSQGQRDELTQIANDYSVPISIDENNLISA